MRSLGGAILSDFLRDAQRGRGIFSDHAAAPWERIAGLRRFVTTGCTISFFVAGLLWKVLPEEG